jgi:hypothetical protein
MIQRNNLIIGEVLQLYLKNLQNSHVFKIALALLLELFEVGGGKAGNFFELL